MNTTNPLIISGPYNRMRFGLKVVNAGDLDSDGISGLFITPVCMYVCSLVPEALIAFHIL